jgi:hypothetical protein
MDEIVCLLEVPQLAALCLTCNSLRFHAHPRLYRLAHNYCSNIDKDKSIGPKSRLPKLEKPFSVRPKYAQFIRKHTAVKQWVFNKMWSSKSLGSLEHLYFPWLSHWSVTKLEHAMSRLRLDISITEMTIVTSSGENGDYEITLLLLSSLYLFRGLRKLNLNLRDRDPSKIKLDDFLSDIECPQLEHLVLVGTPTIFYALEFLPNLKYYEVLFEDQLFEANPSEKEGWDWTHDLIVLYRLRKANVKFRYGPGICSELLELTYHEVQLYDHSRQIIPWMLESHYCFHKTGNKTDPYSLDLVWFDAEIRTRVLDVANSLPFNTDIATVRIEILADDTKPFHHLLPPNVSTLDLLFDEKLDTPDIIDSTISKLPHLRHLILRFPAEAIDEIHLVSPLLATRRFPRFFFGLNALPFCQINLTDKRGRRIGWAHVDCYKFSSKTGWWAAGLELHKKPGVWCDLGVPGPTLCRIDQQFTRFMSRNSRLEVTAYLYGCDDFPLDIV